MKKLTKKYARHAERFGFEGVWESAKGELPPLELGNLSLRLQRIDQRAAERLDDRARRRWKPWKLPQHEARELAEALDRFGLPDRKLAAMATVTTAPSAMAHRPRSPRVLLADRIGVSRRPRARGIDVRSPGQRVPVARLERLELLEEIAIAACRASRTGGSPSASTGSNRWSGPRSGPANPHSKAAKDENRANPR